jgi:hypothetical protein
MMGVVGKAQMEHFFSAKKIIQSHMDQAGSLADSFPGRKHSQIAGTKTTMDGFFQNADGAPLDQFFFQHDGSFVL